VRPRAKPDGDQVSAGFASLRDQTIASLRLPVVIMCPTSSPVRRKPFQTYADASPRSSLGESEKQLTTPSATSLSQIVRSAEIVARRSCSVDGAVSSSRNALPKQGCDSVEATSSKLFRAVSWK